MTQSENLLSIAIPTFNRKHKALSQLGFFISEKCTIASIRLYDNNSTDDTLEHVKNNLPNHKIKYVKNKSNLGLVGNLLKIIEETESEYIWMVGDDDNLKPGITDLVINAINKNKPDFIFINHCAKDLNGNTLLESALPENPKSLLHVFRHSGSTMMFIGACVYKTSLLKECIEKDTRKKNRLTAPIHWSFYCSQNNKVEYITEIKIDNIWGNTSWASQNFNVFYKDLPIDLLRTIFTNHRKSDALLANIIYSPKVIKAWLNYGLNKIIQKKY